MKKNSKKAREFNFIFIDDGRTDEEANEAIRYVIDVIKHNTKKLNLAKQRIKDMKG
ncbi:hypothetical protein MH215_10295 [Paenibacillus sp. ACRSA]|uniref:hypothetical protein n=1 Tax=Paenibacillus sp. ACRSA TaxID=2918211 RepID=UPI001EF73A20|nr:hypothetical protein [Paenibacillus sp. ACRSA]MCG7377385.1 hypothetical protein [Paenibacillus sp. ACRSA]